LTRLFNKYGHLTGCQLTGGIWPDTGLCPEPHWGSSQRLRLLSNSQTTYSTGWPQVLESPWIFARHGRHE